jgi:hypothetical protein
MRRAFDLIIILLFCAWPVNAQNRVWEFVKTHKVVIAQSVVTGLARAAVTESSIHCQKVSRGCNETNSDIGKHPSATVTRAYGYGSAGALITLNFVWWHETGKADVGYAEDPKALRWLMPLWNVPLNIVDALTTRNNVHDAEYLQHKQVQPGIKR